MRPMTAYFSEDRVVIDKALEALLKNDDRVRIEIEDSCSEAGHHISAEGPAHDVMALIGQVAAMGHAGLEWVEV